MPKETNKQLGDLLAEIDAQVREAAVHAHDAVLKKIAKTEPLTLGEIEIPREALLPRDVLELDKAALEFDLYMRDNGVSLSRGFRLSCGGTKATVKMEWKSVPAPEVTSLVRTKCETKIHETPLTQAKEINENG